MANKKQSKEFFDKVTKAVVEMGATSTGDKYGYEWTLDTIVGKLDIIVDPDSKHCFSVFTKFQDVEAAKQKFACNPFSGKYNFMIGAVKELTVDKAVECALIHLEATQE
ncbi:MAG: hypothetical protein P8J32_04555 [bacterium]|nr:hypothetical protein [bacterium]